MFAAVMLLLCAMLAASAASAQVYKWKDADGKVHYSNVPPSQGGATQVQDRVGSFSGPAVVSEASGTGGAAKGTVTLYSTVSCGYCKMARAYLTRRGVRFTERDVEQSDAAKADYRKLGARGVPVILVGSQRMDGYDEARLAAMLKDAGY
jgi:glutaredoxin